MKFGVGQSPKRLEDQILLSGGGRYTDDVQVAGAAHGFVYRSPMAHGAITTLDVSAAREAPGVVAVLTRDELEADKVGDINALTQIKNRDGEDHARAPWPILARDRVRYAGQPVAFIIADTLDQAQEAADLIEFDVDEAPVEVDTLGATREGAHQIYPHIAGNEIFDFSDGDEAAVNEVFATAARVTKAQLVNNRLVSNALEPRSAIAEPVGERFHLYAPSQGPAFLHQQLAGMLGLEAANLRIITGNVGGGFGTKAFLYPEVCLTLWAAKRLGRIVRWTGDRSEIFLSDVHGRDNVTIGELAMDADGRFLAIRATTYAAMGAYLSNFGALIPTEAAVGMYTGVYKIPHCFVNVKGVVTNTVPVDAYRGAGRPEAAYIIERLVDIAAREMGMAPDALRRLNFPTPEEMPHTMGLGAVIDSGDFAGAMDAAMAGADWSGFEARRAETAKAGKLRGIGMATYIERCGGGGMSPARVKFEDDDTITMLMGAMDSGQGHATAYTQILSERLGVDVEKIRMKQGDTDSTPPGFTGGSKSIPVGGASLSYASDKVIAKGRELAAHILETAAADIEFGDATFTVAGTDRTIDLFELAKIAKDPARLPEGMEPGLDAEHDHTAEAATFPNGCHIAEVEVDPDTGETTIVNFTVVDDFGVALNPMLLEGQVHGGIAQGIGQAMTEHTAYDGDGQLLAGSFMDYHLPRADDFPPISFSTRNVPCTTNLLGVKGAGEAGAIGAPPAFINAVVDAIHGRTGAVHVDMPATREKVWRALQG